MHQKPWKLVAIGIPVRFNGLEIEIMTQLRLVRNQDYDPISDRTWEAIGETVKEGESVLDALIRGFREECGDEQFMPVDILGAPTDWSTGKGDHEHLYTPLCFLQNLAAPQPWAGPCHVVTVPHWWEPDYSKSDGEAGDHCWWSAEHLKHELDHRRETFHRFHYPAFWVLSDGILQKTFPFPFRA